MKKILKVSLILSLMITSLFAETTQEQQEKEKKEELLVKVREHKKIETPAEVLERLRKDGEKAKKSTIDDVLTGKIGR